MLDISAESPRRMSASLIDVPKLDQTLLAAQMAGGPVAVALLFERRLLGGAEGKLADRTAGVEMAAARRVERARHLALQDDALAPRLRIGDRNGREQRF